MIRIYQFSFYYYYYFGHGNWEAAEGLHFLWEAYGKFSRMQIMKFYSQTFGRFVYKMKSLHSGRYSIDRHLLSGG